MRAACFIESGKPMEVTTVPDPAPGPGEVLLRVRGCGICGSDLHVTELGGAVRRGTVMGHEFAGEIVAVGRDPDHTEGQESGRQQDGRGPPRRGVAAGARQCPPGLDAVGFRRRERTTGDTAHTCRDVVVVVP